MPGAPRSPSSLRAGGDGTAGVNHVDAGATPLRYVIYGGKQPFRRDAGAATAPIVDRNFTSPGVRLSVCQRYTGFMWGK